MKTEIYFTEAEKKILGLVLEGKQKGEMAEFLNISTHTVKAHLSNIYQKCGVHNKVQLVIFVIKNEILKI